MTENELWKIIGWDRLKRMLQNELEKLPNASLEDSCREWVRNMLRLYLKFMYEMEKGNLPFPPDDNPYDV